MMLRILRSFAMCTVVLTARMVVAQSLQMADGKVLLASVEEASGDGLRVRRLDNGGVLDLRWDHLSPASALAVKRQFDLVGDNQDAELLERAEEVEYLDNGTRRSIIGKIVERGKDVVVQQKGVPFRVPTSNVIQVRTIDVPATQIYTKDEFYAAKLAAIQPGDKADKHVLLAKELIKFRDYDRASEHLEKAKQLNNSIDPAHIEKELQRLRLYKDAAKEREQLDMIQAARSRNTLVDYAKGVTLIAQFEKDFLPQSKLKGEFEVEKKRFNEGRSKFLGQYVADQLRRAIYFVAEKKIQEDSCTLQAARDYAENKMTEDLFARIAQQSKLELDEVKQLWSDRAKYPVGKRTEHFAYGIGSWILTEKGILKGTDVEKEKGKQSQGSKDDANDPNVARVAKLIKQARDRQNAAKRGAGGAQEQKEQTDEDWWKQADHDEKRNWLRAYYAEFGGQLVITYAHVEPCITCYGVGSTPTMGPDGKMTKTKCFLCHGTKWVRSFKAY